MSQKDRGTSKKGSVTPTKSEINESRKKVLDELKELFYRTSERHKLHAKRRKMKRMGLKNIAKRNNTTDSEINNKINQIRKQAAKLGNLLTKENRKKIDEETITYRDKLHKYENTKFSKLDKERAINYLNNLARIFDNKQKYHFSKHHDQNYYGVNDLEHLFDTIDPDECYIPI